MTHRLGRRYALSLALLSILPGTMVRAQDDPKAAAIEMTAQGGRAFEAGQLDRALQCFQKALERFQSVDNKRGIGLSLSNIGLIYARLGQSRKALEYYERALEATDENDLPAMAVLLTNLGSVATQLGQHREALDFLTRAAEIEEKRGNRKGYAAAMDGLGQVYGITRQYDKALEHQKKALETLQPTGSLRDIARVLSNIGATAKIKGDYDQAVRYLTESLALKRRFANPEEMAAGLANLALICFDKGKLEAAGDAFAEAILNNEAVSREIRDADQVGAFQDWFRSSLYRRYAHTLLNLKRPEDALTVLERGRGQGLARQAAQTRADYGKTLAAADAGRLQAAQSAFNAATADLRAVEGLEFLADEAGDSPGTRRIREVRARYDAAERQLSELRADLCRRYPAYRRLSGATPVTAAELKALTARNPDTLYLQWAVGAEATSLLFTLSNADGIKGFVLEGGEGTVAKQVDVWRAAIEKQDTAGERAAAQALYKTLFSTVEAAGLLAPDRYARLVLVGDGPLLDAPFGALLDSGGKRLVERFPLAVSGSLGALTWPEERQKATGSLLVAADPRSPGAPALPAARQEGASVAALFPGARLLVGAEVDKARILSELPRHRILHFATHGALDPEQGLHCGLLLASPEGSEDIELLEARELLGMRLSAQLAVLSACDTGQGEHSGGEGLLGLTWAFRAAGCPSIVASLWSVEDTATGKLMTGFYRELKAGKRKDEALREAMLAVQKESPAPLFWAAFQVNGDTSSLTPP